MSSHKSCACCGLPAKLRKARCSRCKSVSYCSTRCQQTHWKVHSKNCVAPAATGSSKKTTAKTTAKTTTTNAPDGPPNYTEFGGCKTEFLEITTDKFINDCLRKDLFPPEGTEKVWGIQMGSSSGTNVFAAWKALFFQAVGESGDEQVSKAGVARFRHEVVLAFAHGTLPQFFEEKVRTFEENTNYYVDALVKAGFADIPWNTGIHLGFHEYAVGHFDPTK